jgi:hypothetical protein
MGRFTAQGALQEAEKVSSLSIGTHRSHLSRLGPGNDLSRRARGRRQASPGGERRASEQFPGRSLLSRVLT